MLGAAVAVAIVVFLLKAIAAQSTGLFLVPLAAAACICHVVVHAKAARAVTPPGRLAAISNILLAGAVLLQVEFTPGYNCAEDTLSSVLWRLGMASEEACILLAGAPAIIIDLLLYIPVALTWPRLLAAARPRAT
jgi:hypothetical protein